MSCEIFQVLNMKPHHTQGPLPEWAGGHPR